MHEPIEQLLLSQRDAFLHATKILPDEANTFLDTSVCISMLSNEYKLKMLETSGKRAPEVYDKTKILTKNNYEILLQEMQDCNMKIFPTTGYELIKSRRRTKAFLRKRSEVIACLRGDVKLPVYHRKFNGHHIDFVKHSTHSEYTDKTIRSMLDTISAFEIRAFKKMQETSQNMFLTIEDMKKDNKITYSCISRHVSDSHKLLHNCNGTHELEKNRMTEMLLYSACAPGTVHIISSDKSTQDILKFIFKNKVFFRDHIRTSMPKNDLELNLYEMERKGCMFTGNIIKSMFIYDKGLKNTFYDSWVYR